MQGGAGSDTYYVDNAGDRVIEAAGAGTDRVYASVSHALAANVENLTLTGTAKINGTGNSLANTLVGNAASNVLNGGTGADVIQGGAGNDLLVGGLGRDVMSGGSGADTFRFSSTAESGRGAARDVIRDFQHGVDHFDLAAIDASTRHAGNQAFHFIGAKAFTGAAGEVAYKSGVVSVDVNGDRVSDLEVGIENRAGLTHHDFIL